MAAVKKAKIASSKKGSGGKYYLEGTEVTSARMIGSLVGLRNYTAVIRVDNGEFVTDAGGVPLNWKSAPLVRDGK